jgi:hypothetical protein
MALMTPAFANGALRPIPCDGVGVGAGFGGDEIGCGVTGATWDGLEPPPNNRFKKLIKCQD